MELVLLFWVAFCIAVAILAARYNRSGFGWFIFSVFLSPLLGLVFVLACGPRAARPATEEQPAAPAREHQGGPASDRARADGLPPHVQRMLARQGA